MTNIRTVIGIVLLGAIVTYAQNQSSPYDSLMSLFEAKDRPAIHAFVGSLSKQEFKDMLIEYVQENPPSPQVNTFAAMSMLSALYYEHGAGASDGCTQWAEDVQDQSYPVEWRNVILGHPPFKIQDLTPGEVTVFSNTLESVAFSTNAPPGLRREALLGLQHVMSLGDYVDLLKKSASSKDEDSRFRREALLHMGRIVYRGRLKSQQSPEFSRVANEYDSLLSDLGSCTNLPPVLDESVKSLERQKKPSRNKDAAASH